jgi:hypothetical protein
MISIKFLFKDSKCGRKGEVPASSIKRNQNIFSSLIHRVYQWAIKPTKGFIKFQKQVPLFNGPKSRENIPDKRFPTANQRRDFSGNVAFLV